MASTKMGYMLAAGLAVVLLGACNNQSTEEARQTAGNVPATSEQAAAPESNVQFPLTGTVAETFGSGGYSYLRLESNGREYWVAVSAAQVEQGEEVTLADGQVMYNFHSRTLDRTFPEIIFASSLNGQAGGAATATAESSTADSFSAALQKEGQSAPSAGSGGGMMGAMGSGKAVVPSEEVQVEKASGENAYTVGEIFAQAGQLQGQEVKVRGKVMKVSRNIMGKNWLHLQDGTGDATKNTHDLVVTTDAVPESDSVVTVEGTLAADKDFGAGYRYDAIIEEAAVNP